MDERKGSSVSWFHGSGHHSGGLSGAAQLTSQGLEAVEESDDVGISPLFIPFSLPGSGAEKASSFLITFSMFLELFVSYFKYENCVKCFSYCLI